MPRKTPIKDPSSGDNGNSLSREECIALAAAADPRYKHAAFVYIANAVKEVARSLSKNSSGHRHITGAELTKGLRDMLLRDFGRLAIDVLKSWHITQTADFGEIVYDLVETRLLSVSPQDSRDDFRDVYDFHEAFVKSLECNEEKKPMPVIMDLRSK